MTRLCRRCLILSLSAVTLYAQQNTGSFDYEPRLDLPEKPTITFLYGPTRSSARQLSQGLASGASLEMKLGFSSLKTKRPAPEILEHRFTHLSIARFSPDLAPGSAPEGIRTDMWRFGLGWDKGYGYSLGSSALTMFHTFGVHWSALSVKTAVADSSDKSVLSLYEGGVRFGSTAAGGVMLHVTPSLIIRTSFDRSIILPRHLFWKWGGSVLLEGMGYALIDRFVDEVMKSSPGASPVVHLILRTALSYGFYELRREKMNWPFESDAPILHDSFTFGASIVF